MTDNPIYSAALEAAAVVPAMAAPGHWLVSDVDRIHDAILALPVPSLRETLAAMVQPLEWEEHGGGTWQAWCHVFQEPHYCEDVAERDEVENERTRRILAALGVKE